MSDLGKYLCSVCLTHSLTTSPIHIHLDLPGASSIAEGAPNLQLDFSPLDSYDGGTIIHPSAVPNPRLRSGQIFLSNILLRQGDILFHNTVGLVGPEMHVKGISVRYYLS